MTHLRIGQDALWSSWAGGRSENDFGLTLGRTRESSADRSSRRSLRCRVLFITAKREAEVQRNQRIPLLVHSLQLQETRTRERRLTKAIIIIICGRERKGFRQESPSERSTRFGHLGVTYSFLPGEFCGRSIHSRNIDHILCMPC